MAVCFLGKKEVCPSVETHFPGNGFSAKEGLFLLCCLVQSIPHIPFCMPKLMKIEMDLVGGGGWDLGFEGGMGCEREGETE
ncbi:unnamed protein product [Prunus armeniaca]